MAGRLIHRVPTPVDALALLESHAAIVVDRFFDADACARWVRGVYAARADWTQDFGGEQFSLGRAFYTHYETERSREYFAAPAESDANVERAAPGLQAALRDVVAQIVGGSVVRRRGWCGPGVHVFPPRAPVAHRGGVVHFDIEGLPAHHLAKRAPAITVVAMLQAPETDGGLEVWDVTYDGRVHATAGELEREHAVVTYRTGDVVLIDSYRLHQIQPFTGDRDRISATVHAARVDRDRWECWF